MPGPVQALLYFTAPFVFGALFIFLGFRRAKKETARLKDPTTWDYLNQAAGYWILGVMFLGYGVNYLVSLI